MSRSRMYIVLAVVVVVGAIVAYAASNSSGNGDLEKQVQALTQRVTQLEGQLQAMRGGGELDKQANIALQKINQLVAGGQIEEAKAALPEFNAKYGASKLAPSAQSLARELAVFGKSAPTDWNIEKWFQGQGDIDLNSGKPTVVVFWETWCPHCRNEVPKLQQLYSSNQSKGLQMIGLTRVTKSATEAEITSIINENKVTYPIAKEGGQMSNYFAVSGIPAAAVVKDGKIVWRGHPGKITDDLLKAWL